MEVTILPLHSATPSFSVPGCCISSAAPSPAPELPLRRCKKQQVSKSRGHPGWCPQRGSVGRASGARRKRAVSKRPLLSGLCVPRRETSLGLVQSLNPQLQLIVIRKRNADATFTPGFFQPSEGHVHPLPLASGPQNISVL